MRDYQAEQLMKEPDKPIPDCVRLLKDEDIDRWGSLFYLIYFTILHVSYCALKGQFKLTVYLGLVKQTVGKFVAAYFMLFLYK